MALVRPEQDSGVPGGRELSAFVDALAGRDVAALSRARTTLVDALGPDAVPAASAVAATFSMNDRIANGIGIPVDDMVLKITGDLRAELGLNAFRSAINTFRHLPAGAR